VTLARSRRTVTVERARAGSAKTGRRCDVAAVTEQMAPGQAYRAGAMSIPLVLSMSKGERLMVRQAHHERFHTTKHSK